MKLAFVHLFVNFNGTASVTRHAETICAISEIITYDRNLQGISKNVLGLF